MFISAVQLSNSAYILYIYIYAHIYTIFHTLFHYGLSEDIKYISLFYIVRPHCLFIVYICWFVSASPKLPFLPFPASPPPLATTSLFSISVSTFLFPRYAHLCHSLGSHICDVVWYLSFSFWLTSFGMIISRSIHVLTNGIILFLYVSE